MFLNDLKLSTVKSVKKYKIQNKIKWNSVSKEKNADSVEIGENPAFFRFKFNISETGDTFLDFSGWGKGCVFINGFNIGRFWKIGPQKRLYIPAPLLKKGENEIIIFETEGIRRPFVELFSEPKFNN